MRIEALARRPADDLRQIADPVVFALATQVGTHVIWKVFALPEAALPVVIELACSTMALSRVAAIGRLARQYRTAGSVAPDLLEDFVTVERRVAVSDNFPGCRRRRSTPTSGPRQFLLLEQTCDNTKPVGA